MPIIRGSDGDEAMRGTSQSDEVWGLEGLDTFYWRPGMGNDTYHGGTGSERFDANPYTPGNPGGDTLYLEGDRGVRVSLLSTEDGFVQSGDERLQFTGVERIYGTEGNDVVSAESAVINTAGGGKLEHGVSIFTGDGDDRIAGSYYDDVLDGGSGDDTINADAGNDFVHSSTGNDRINGGLGQDNIRWGNGDANHSPGDDWINGGGDNDLINIWIKRGDISAENADVGIEGVDVNIYRVLTNGAFFGTAFTDIGGNASLHFGDFELAWTHAGNDVLNASQAHVSVTGQGVNFNTRWGHDQLLGSVGDDTLDGSMGKDTIQGGEGNDEIWIGDGRDGDGDRDTLIFRAGDDADEVYGFETGRDVLDLGGRNYSTTEGRDGTLLDFGGGDSILLHDVLDFI